MLNLPDASLYFLLKIAMETKEGMIKTRYFRMRLLHREIGLLHQSWAWHNETHVQSSGFGVTNAFKISKQKLVSFWITKNFQTFVILC